MERQANHLVEESEMVAKSAPDSWVLFESSPDNDSSANEEMVLAALVAVVSATPGARGLWRAWLVDLDKYEADGDVERLYIAEASPAIAVALETSLREAVRLSGDSDARVDVVASAQDVPQFQRQVQARGELLWASDSADVMRVARIFDGVRDDGAPFFAPDRDKLGAEDSAGVLAYMRAATTLLRTPGTIDDIVDASRGAVVPTNFRSDGTWIWADTAEYYLEQHQLAPDARLLAHIHASEGQPAELDAVQQYRAMNELYQEK